jgi:hypothetical protein
MGGRDYCLILVSGLLQELKQMIVYWDVAPTQPGEEKLSDVSCQQLHIKNSILNTRNPVA